MEKKLHTEMSLVFLLMINSFALAESILDGPRLLKRYSNLLRGK